MGLNDLADEAFVGARIEPDEFNIEVYRGDTLSFRVRLREKNAQGNPGDYLDLTNATFLAQVRADPDAADVWQTLDVAPGDQTGEVVISLSEIHTADLFSGYWDLQTTWTSPTEVITYLAGWFKVAPKDVSRS